MCGRLNRIVLTVMLLCFVLLAGCGHLSKAYVKQDRDTYNAVEPYLRRDAFSHPEDGPAIMGKLESWDARLKAAEKYSR